MTSLSTDACINSKYRYKAEHCAVGNRVNMNILRGNSVQKTLEFPLLSFEDLIAFVSFLNENEIEPVHITDCFHDFVYEKMASCV